MNLEKNKFYDNVTQELGLQRPTFLVAAAGDFNLILVKKQLDMKTFMVALVLVHVTEKEEDCWSFVSQTDLVFANTWFKKQRKESFHSGNFSVRIDFILLDMLC